MTPNSRAYVGARIHDGTNLHENHALVLDRAGTCRVVPVGDLPSDCQKTQLNGGIITPGFVDLQVNGGGGVMFNNDPSVDALRTIATAHATLGTIAFLPTLITDTPEITQAAITAVAEAIEQNVPGIVGIHLEGPHLSVARKGAHDADLIRRMEPADLEMLLNAADRLPNVMVTLAPENTSNEQISLMAEAGIIVSLGHTNADYDTCRAAFDAGARCATHLFNAMSQLTSREPGLVGAALSHPDVFAGLIADAIHVHPTSIRLATKAKGATDKIFLVTDAMATAGSDIEQFSLNGRQVFRKEGRLTLTDGTLAGADLELGRAVEVMATLADDDVGKAIARATSLPASLLRNSGHWGTLDIGGIIYIEDGFGRVRALT